MIMLQDFFHRLEPHSVMKPVFSVNRRMEIKAYTFLYFQIKHCDDLGISAKKSSTLFLFLGICSTLGRLGGGFLCDVSKRIKARFIFQSAAFIMGVSTMVLPLAQTYGVLAAYAIVFGVVDGMMMVTFIIELFNSMEESKKASALGFTLMCSGAFATGSPPLSGMIFANIFTSV